MTPPGFLLVLACFVFCLETKPTVDYPYNIGAGIYDITGPAAQVGMMGYANFDQQSAGIHFRLRARAFVVQDKSTSKTIAYVNLDLCFSTIVIKKRVIDLLQTKLPGYDYENVLLTSTHTHSGPAGYSWYTIYDIMCLGYKKRYVDTIATGIVNAIYDAHMSKKSAQILINYGELVDPLTNINRSPTAYLNNPDAEKKMYNYNVDKLMTQIRFQAEDGSEIGLINWFAVHGTSMTNGNGLISGDNKGYAMYLFEMYKNGKDTLPGRGPFVAAFSNSNEGDVTPNVKGAFCPNNQSCDIFESTCDGASETCHGRGPGRDQFESTLLIGTYQFNKALELYENAKTVVEGPVDYRHTFVDLQHVLVLPQYTGLATPISTCIAALGDSFAAGTTDGPGDFDFHQGSNSTKDNPFWNFVGGFLSEPSLDQIKCQYPKPILLNTGGTHFPTDWTPSILPLQIFRLGQLFIVAVPSEFTTMSGRRLRNTIQSTISSLGGPKDAIVVISGLSNAYSQYVTTTEEFNIQRYEGASTLYGPHTLNAYQQLFDNLTIALLTNKTVPPGIPPTDFTNEVVDIQPPVLFDDGPIGDVHTPPLSSYSIGETASVVFYAGDPRNNYLIEDTFLTVEHLASNGSWLVVAVDGHWETRFYWEHISNIEFEESYAKIEWDIPLSAVPGTYRIKHFGYKKNIDESIEPYVGISPQFSVTMKSDN